MLGRYDLTDDAQKVEFLKEVVGVIAGLHSPVEREVYGARCAELAGISSEAMGRRIKRSSPAASVRSKNSRSAGI